MKLRAAAAALTLGFAALEAPVSAETLYAPHGARGDFGGELRCPANTYVVGFEGGTGQIIDRIGIVCAPVDASGKARAPSFKSQALGGGGGAPNGTRCPGNMIVTSGHVSLNVEKRQVWRFTVACTFIGTGERAYATIEGTGREMSFGDPVIDLFRDESGRRRDFVCKPGEAMTGLTVRHGEHVNALGLICNDVIKPKAEVAAAPAALCKQGEVWRERFDGDVVCVHPDRRWIMADGSCRRGWVKLGVGPKKDTCGTPEKKKKAEADAAAAAAAEANYKLRSGNPQDFAGTWNTTRRGETLILTLRVDGTNVAGEFTNPSRPSSNGTLTGTIRSVAGDNGPIVNLKYNSTQPTVGDGSFYVFTDGRLEGGFTWQEPGKAKRTYIKWNGTRASN